MSLIQSVFFELCPAALLFVCGYSLTLPFNHKLNNISLLEKFFIILVMGTCSIIIPTIIWVVFFDTWLPQFFILCSVSFLCVSIYFLKKYSSVVRRDYIEFSTVFRLTAFGSPIEQFALVSLIFFVVKSIFYFSIVPINVNALYFYLPSSLHFVNFSHVYPYADPPVASILYAWSYPITVGFTSEPFRQIPLLFVASFPLLVFAFSKKVLPKKYALIAMILSAFSPFLDMTTYLWPWDTDIIAGCFAILAVYFVLRDFRHHEVFAALALSLAILTKTPFGLAAALIIFILILKNSKRQLLAGICFSLALVLILVIGWVYSFSLVSIANNVFLALFASMIVIGLLIFAFFKSEVSFRFNIWVFIAFLFPTFVWVGRQVALGGQPLALPVFSSLSSAGVTWWNSLQSQVLASSSSQWNVIEFLMPFYHPLLGLCLLPILLVGMFYAFKRSNLSILFLIFLMYFYVWFSSFSIWAVYRHLYPALFILFPIIGIGYFELAKLLKIQNRLIEFLLIFSLILLESTQDISVYLSSSILASDNAIKWFVSFTTRNPPWFSYDIIKQIPNAISIIACCFFIVIILSLSLRVKIRNSIFNSRKLHIRRCLKPLTLAICCLSCLSIMIIPITYHAISISHGSLASYNVDASWYKSEIEMVPTLTATVKNGLLLTFGFDAFYYLAASNVTYFDLLSGNIVSYPFRSIDVYSIWKEAANTTNISTIENVFKYFNVNYVLLPTSSAWAYEDYQRFCQISPMFSILIERGSMSRIISFGSFDLYQVDFHNTINYGQQMSLDGFDNWAVIAGRWEVKNGLYLGNYTGLFGVSVAGDLNWTNIALEGAILSTHDVRETGLIFRYQNPLNYYRVFISGNWNQLRVMKMVEGNPTYPENWSRNVSTKTDTWYILKLIAIGGTFRIYLNDQLQFSFSDPDPILSGKIGVGGYDDVSYFDNISVTLVNLGIISGAENGYLIQSQVYR
jgi:hypothetical protein